MALKEAGAFHPAVEEVSQIVAEMAGIQLGFKQATMVDNRLKTRLLKLGLPDYEAYLQHLRANPQSESQALLSLLTTHHTFFFREFLQFEFLLNKGLRGMVEAAAARPDKTIRVWSAACSRGQEVYSLAMFLNFHVAQIDPSVKFEIWGSDVDPESVKTAKNGVYKTEELRQSPAMYLEGNWIRGKGEVSEFSKAKDRIKIPCKFETVNLLQSENFLRDKTFDLIFCRNVFIYFDQQQVQKVTNQFAKRLNPNGMIFLGVTESLNGLKVPLNAIGPSVYVHPTVAAAPQRISVAPNWTEEKKPSRILCVDDSSTIHALLAKILTAENGFVIGAKAMNGRQALEILKRESFDAITLDLHMPEVDGLGFLKEYRGSAPVVILSSVNRDDQSLAQKALAAGARDYVEKPSLENLAQAGNEIRSKIRMALNSIIVAHKPEAKKKVKVLIVDDSATIRKLLTSMLSQDSEFEVVGEAERPRDVPGLIEKLKPDVITLDIQMPEMDGVTLLKSIFPKYRIPTVMISSLTREDGPAVLDALSSGAVDYIEKPKAGDLPAYSSSIRERLKIAAKAKVAAFGRARRATRVQNDAGKVILIGASTGGTEALKVVLESMPDKIPPVLIVQHMPPVFTAAFAARLDSLVPFKVVEAANGMEIEENTVYIAPGGKQMGVAIVGAKRTLSVNEDAPVNRHKPSVDYMFASAREAGLQGVAAVLTGMGADGARELKKLRDAGFRTLAQDEKTSVVYGMPNEALRGGGAERSVAIENIGAELLELISSRKT